MPTKKTWEKKAGVKRCPYCDNEIKAAAKKCQYCWEFLSKSNKVSIDSQQDVVEVPVYNNFEYTENSFASFITWTNLNRIWRAKYFTRYVIFMLLLYVCLFVLVWIISGLSGSDADNFIAIPMLAFLGVSLYWNIILNNKRLHDYWWSWWLQLLLLVPIANIVILIFMYFKPWDEWENQYGKPSETKTREEVFAVIFLVLLVICFIAAIAGS